MLLINRHKIYRQFFILVLTSIISAQDFNIARIQYSGGGDWYADPSSLPNLIDFISDKTNIKIENSEYKIKLTSESLYGHTFLYLTGHGNIRFSDEEIGALRNHLLKGAFLHADDNYGMHDSFKREMKKVFPEKEWVELPIDHPIYSCYFNLPNGLPKIHEHDGKPPQGLGLFDNKRLIVFFTYESDLGDGWEDSEVHNNPEVVRQSALQMGTNIVWFSLTQ
jgi:hypothetical protein|tara:strand:- start:351 stop:1016 length:666 start_codon:yes stop_codon:yes gene_type:complete